MTDQLHARRGQAMLRKRGDILPENAVPMTDDEVYEVQMKRIEQFKPESEVRAFKYGSFLVSANVAVSGVMISNIVRQNFNLGALRRGLTYGPALFIPSIISVGIHEMAVKRSILLGKEECPLCISLRSGVLQVASGVVYPYVLSILTCLPTARDYYTLPLPASKSGTSYFKLLKQVSPSKMTMLLLALSNMFVGMWMARRELQIFHKHFEKPPRQLEMPVDLDSN
ncbi:complex I assembly factor TMEM126B, mitochondrial [Aplysia californica]|uniref:Complex I assembly factor TMEM126B, mitochondrial n=1 Tax=Aplysia californica TaxID=6500 RepID=A0ABM0JW06_APLCA|nr:complex I assembly factor TMEM126B, mitochondrial [Aplysia californica]